MATTNERCPLCKRELGTDNLSEHHLIPKEKGGKQTVILHNVCHRAIHASLDNYQLANYYHTIDRLLEHENIQKFVKWIAKKPIDYYVETEESKERKRKRRR